MKKDYNEAISRMIKWGEIRNIKDTDPIVQIRKIQEETTELMDAQRDNDLAEKEDAVGDIIQSTISYCLAAGLNFQKCLYGTLEVIEPRLGYTIGGCFIKEKDLADKISFERKMRSMNIHMTEEIWEEYFKYVDNKDVIHGEMLKMIKGDNVK